MTHPSIVYWFSFFLSFWDLVLGLVLLRFICRTNLLSIFPRFTEDPTPVSQQLDACLLETSVAQLEKILKQLKPILGQYADVLWKANLVEEL